MNSVGQVVQIVFMRMEDGASQKVDKPVEIPKCNSVPVVG